MAPLNSNVRPKLEKIEIYEPIDARGNQIYIGSRVRIIATPDFSWVQQPEIRAERERVFKHLLGQCKTVDSFDQYGFVGMTFTIRKGVDAGFHFVGLEPHFLLVQNKSVKSLTQHSNVRR